MKYENRNEEQLDKLMKAALTSKERPDDLLNQKIIDKWSQEDIFMRKGTKMKYRAAVAAAAYLLITSVGVGAAVKYLDSQSIAEKAELSGKIADAFSGENAVEINESKEAGEYRITLLGITSGEALTGLGEIAPSDTSTYATIAIERLDGTPIPDISEDGYASVDFFISPFIQGLNPARYNIASMNGAYSDFVENGIMYRLIECDDIALFADRTLYLGISDTTFYDNKAYDYNEETGEISRKEDYSGINVLFELPIDEKKADSALAEEYLSKLEASWESGEESCDTEEDAISDQIEKEYQLYEEGKLEEILEGAVLQEDMTQTVQKEDDGYEYYYAYEEDGTSGGGYIAESQFRDGKYLDVTDGPSDGKTMTEYIELLTINDDGTATVECYKKTVVLE